MGFIRFISQATIYVILIYVYIRWSLKSVRKIVNNNTIDGLLAAWVVVTTILSMAWIMWSFGLYI